MAKKKEKKQCPVCEKWYVNLGVHMKAHKSDKVSGYSLVTTPEVAPIVTESEPVKSKYNNPELEEWLTLIRPASHFAEGVHGDRRAELIKLDEDGWFLTEDESLGETLQRENGIVARRCIGNRLHDEPRIYCYDFKPSELDEMRKRTRPRRI